MPPQGESTGEGRAAGPRGEIVARVVVRAKRIRSASVRRDPGLRWEWLQGIEDALLFCPASEEDARRRIDFALRKAPGDLASEERQALEAAILDGLRSALAAAREQPPLERARAAAQAGERSTRRVLTIAALGVLLAPPWILVVLTSVPGGRSGFRVSEVCAFVPVSAVAWALVTLVAWIARSLARAAIAPLGGSAGPAARILAATAALMIVCGVVFTGGLLSSRGPRRGVSLGGLAAGEAHVAAVQSFVRSPGAMAVFGVFALSSSLLAAARMERDGS